MKRPEILNTFLHTPTLTRTRIALAVVVAVITDGLQFFLGPLGWLLVDQAIDAVAMILTMWLLGFHVLLLPTFLVKLVPVLDELPTWTACVIAVIALRKREQPPLTQPPASQPGDKPAIDV